MIIVTGASGGLGRLLVPELAKIDGVVATYLNNVPQCADDARERTEWLTKSISDLGSI